VRHEFAPGRLLAGLALIVAAFIYFGAAGDAWEAPWWVAFPVIGGGFVVAAVVGAATQAVRVRRRRRVSRGAAPRP
jgi:hypothetical protein